MKQALDGTTAFHLASAKGNIKVMEVILQAGINEQLDYW